MLWNFYICRFVWCEPCWYVTQRILEVHEISVVFAGFGVLVLLLLIQYHVTVWRHRRKVMVEEVQAVALVRTNAIEHAINTCMNYVMFVWAVLFTKAFQGLHCISRGRLVLAVDLSMVLYPIKPCLVCLTWMQTCFEGDHWPIFWTSLILLVAVVAFPVITAVMNWRYRGGPHSSYLIRSIFVSTTDEFIGRTAWLANSLLIGVCLLLLRLWTLIFTWLGGYCSCNGLRIFNVSTWMAVYCTVTMSFSAIVLCDHSKTIRRLAKECVQCSGVLYIYFGHYCAHMSETGPNSFGLSDCHNDEPILCSDMYINHCAHDSKSIESQSIQEKVCEHNTTGSEYIILTGCLMPIVCPRMNNACANAWVLGLINKISIPFRKLLYVVTHIPWGFCHWCRPETAQESDSKHNDTNGINSVRCAQCKSMSLFDCYETSYIVWSYAH